MIQIGALPTLDDAVMTNAGIQQQQAGVNPLGVLQTMLAQTPQATTPQMVMPMTNKGLDPAKVQMISSGKDPRNMGGHHTLHTITDTALKAWAGGGFSGGLGGLGSTIGDVAGGTSGSAGSSIKAGTGGGGGGSSSLLGSFLGGGGGGKGGAQSGGKGNNKLINDPATNQQSSNATTFGDLISNAFDNSHIGKAVNPLLALFQGNAMPINDGVV